MKIVLLQVFDVALHLFFAQTLCDELKYFDEFSNQVLPWVTVANAEQRLFNKIIAEKIIVTSDQCSPLRYCKRELTLICLPQQLRFLTRRNFQSLGA